jgi:hypothetical protein
VFFFNYHYVSHVMMLGIDVLQCTRPENENIDFFEEHLIKISSHKLLWHTIDMNFIMRKGFGAPENQTGGIPNSAPG